MVLRWIYSQRVKVGEKSAMQMGSYDVKEIKRQIKAVKRKAAEKEAEIQRLRGVTENDLRIAQVRDYDVLLPLDIGRYFKKHFLIL